MRRRFFVDKFENQRAVMEGEAAHHLGRVLRAQPGQLYELSDGSRVWLGRIETVSRNKVDFLLLEELAANEPDVETTLLLAVVKFDAFEWALEKATELGVHTIMPLGAARSEKTLLTSAPKRTERWKKILHEASQQSRRVRLPVLEPLVTPETAFHAHREGVRILLSEDPNAKSLRDVLRNRHADSAILAIGPEGGLTEAELEVARCAHFTIASLGRLILRTETAVVAGLANINFALAQDRGLAS